MRNIFNKLRRFLAKIWLEINLQLTIVGVTGSYGKTSAVNAITEVLSAKYSVNRTDIDLDTIYNLPRTILKTKFWNEVLVLEYGIDHLGEMDRHLLLVKPKIAVLTGITPVHTDEELLGSLENVISEKTKLINSLPSNGLAVFNYDDKEVRKIGQKFSGRKIFYGTSKMADIWAEKISLSLSGTDFNLHGGNQTFKVKTMLLGLPAVYSCLAAWIIGRELKVREDNMLKKMEALKPLPGRFSVEKGPLRTILVNDSRRANPASTITGLRSFSQFSGRKVAILGEMGELGKYSEQMHRLVGQEVSKNKIDILVGVGPLAKNIVDEANKAGMKEVFWAKDVGIAAEILREKLQAKDVIYLKASLLRHLERVILLLRGDKVSCRETICHHYGSCSTCSKFVK